MFHATFDLSLAQQFLELLKTAPETAAKYLRNATTESLLLLENLTKDNSPVGVTELLRGGWAHEVLGSPADGEVLGRVYNPLPYAAAVEQGSKPHWAPLDPLIDWVKAKLDVQDEAEAKHIAKLIQYKIAAKGTTGSHMAQRALDAADADIRQIFRQAQLDSYASLGL